MDINSQYEKIGKNYIKWQKEFFSKREDGAIKFIKESLPSLNGKRVLELGCGNGEDIKLIESLGASETYGIDPSSFMLGEAKKNVSNPENLFLEDMEETSFEDNFFDVIFGRFSFHYLNKFDKVYKELARILKKGGELILVVSHPLRDLAYQKNKVYGDQRIVKVGLYDGNVPIHFPTHTLKDYFSKTFFDHFNLSGYEEEQSPEEYLDESKTPGFMGIKATKK